MRKRYLKVSDLCKIFNISLATAYRWKDEPGFPVIILPKNRFRIDPVALDAWVKAHTQAA